MRHTTFIAVALLLISVHPFGAAAADAILAPGSEIALLPPGGDPGAPAAMKSEVVEAVTGAFRKMGYRVRSPRKVSRDLTGMGRDPCRVLRNCDQAAVLGDLEVGAVVSIALWLEEGEKTPKLVVVRVTHPHGSGVGEVPVGDAGLTDAVGAAVAMAINESGKRRAVPVRIESVPEGARVEIDHAPVGVSPVEVEVQPGKRVVTVSASGFVTESEYVDVPGGGAEAFVHRVELSAVGEGAPEEPAPADPVLPPDESPGSKSPWNYVIGGALLAASAPLLGISAYTAIKHGECYEEDGFGRCRRYHFGTQSGLMLAGGAITLAGGLGMVFMAPIRESGDSPGVTVTAGPASVGIRGEF
jgi:hypothetical protein